MIKSGTSDLFSTILISLYLTGQPAYLEECFKRKIKVKIPLVWGRGYARQEYSSVVLSDSFLSLKFKFSEQFAKLSGPKFLTAATNIPKYSENDLQQIFKTVLEVQAPALTPTPALAPVTSKKPRD